MKTNTARDLLLLAAVAFENKQFDNAGALFASALSSADAPEFLETLNKMTIDGEELNAPDEAVAGEKMPMSKIAKAIAASMEETVEDVEGVSLSSDDEDEDDEELDDEDMDEDSEDEEDESEDEDDEDDEDDEESESDDIDPNEGGERILPSSISSDSGTTVKSKGTPKLIISGISSPIKLKQ
jgi:hypothetical protein